MIDIEEQEQLLLNISKRIKKTITVYAIGGTAMMFLGFKDVTLDVDLVFESEKDKLVFKNAILEIGYQKLDSFRIYGTKKNKPEMFTLGDERLDLFLTKVISFFFSESMQKRAQQSYKFNEKLILKIADPHDIILMKCATDRIKDIDDVKKIINGIKINWDILIKESLEQIKLGNKVAALELGNFLEKLKYKMKVNIPIKVLDILFEIVKKQSKEKKYSTSL